MDPGIASLIGGVLAFLGAILGGLITFIGVKKTINEERRRDREKLEHEEFEKRPFLEFIAFEDFDYAQVLDKDREESMVDVLHCHIDADVQGDSVRFDYGKIDKKHFITHKYTFKNTGQKAIERFTITTNITRNTALIDVRGLEYYMNNGFMNIYTNGKRRIKSGETFHILINYTRVDHVLTTSFSPEFALLFEDEKQRIWYQNMRIINGYLTPTERMDMTRFQEMIRQDGLFSAYKNPMLW
jgi:hypothetical protein